MQGGDKGQVAQTFGLRGSNAVQGSRFFTAAPLFSGRNYIVDACTAVHHLPHRNPEHGCRIAGVCTYTFMNVHEQIAIAACVNEKCI